MKKLFKKSALFGLAGIITAASNIVLANNKVIDKLIRDDLFIYHGNLKLTNSKLNNAEIMGSNHLYNNDFDGPVIINGNTDLKENNFKNEINIQGNIKSENNNYSDKVTINGNFKDKESNFNKEITMIGKAIFEQSNLYKIKIDSNDIKLIDSMVEEVNFYNAEDERNINLYLTKNTKVNGDIIFNNNKGKVYVENTVKLNGNVIGGEVISK